MQTYIIILFFPDTNECAMNMSRCDENANCTNNEGSYNCSCHNGYYGDGFNCTGEPFRFTSKPMLCYLRKQLFIGIMKRLYFSSIVSICLYNISLQKILIEEVE